MIELDDARWTELKGGCRVPYDPRPAVAKLERGQDVEAAWDELWQELHHQGDVGEASYAVVPLLVRIQKKRGALDWNLYALVSTIEMERHRKSNPPVPEWLRPSYDQAWKDLLELSIADLRETGDDLSVKIILTAMALARGSRKLAGLLGWLDSAEIDKLVEDRLGWSELYG